MRQSSFAPEAQQARPHPLWYEKIVRQPQVPLIEGSPAFGLEDVSIVVYDEDERAGGLAQKNGFGEGGHVVCTILSPLAIPGSFDGVFYHYSLLHTLEDGFGLSSYVGSANDVTPISTIWH